MASSSSTPSANWAELPPDLLSSILLRFSMVEILQNIQRVCRSWRCVCTNPSMWCKIDMRNVGIHDYDYDGMCRHFVDLSGGCLVEINMGFFGTDSLLFYIAERSRNLRCLRLQMCYPITGNGFVSAVTKLTFLEDLEISLGYPYEVVDLKAIGHSCPLLKILKLNRSSFNQQDIKYNDDEALAIAATMTELLHLELFRNTLTNSGLNAILDNCLHLEYLDLRDCLNINLVGDLEKRCVERIRYLRHPDDSFLGHRMR